MIDEAALIAKLDNCFPGRIIYSQSYMKDIGVLGIEVRRHARAQDMSSAQWLVTRGYTWKETGYVEPDMRPGSGTNTKQSDRNALEIADYLFKSFPLVGEYSLTKEENDTLYQAACNVVKKLLKKGGNATAQDKVILTVATIELLKHWSSNQEDEVGSKTFWNYIFLQFGFNAENPDAANAKSRLYTNFQRSIEGTLSQYHRFFAPSDTQRYYTSLLSHAVAPVYSINRLFNILFDFYTSNLNYQYLPEDTSYQMFVKGMIARGNAENKTAADLKLRSDVLSSAQEALFRERPGYMATLCDSIIRKMDALLRGEESGIMDPSRNRWDALLMDWYSKKSAAERASWQGERRRRKAEYVATSKDRIYVQYALRESMVGVTIPRIRLPGVGDKRPYLTIYQGLDAIYKLEMSVIGNDLLLTTKSYFIPLAETSFNFNQAPDLRVEIEYHDEVLYESGRKLNCHYLVFDDMGSCHIPKNGTAHIFAGANSTIDFDGEDGVLQCNHQGQLFKVNLGKIMSVTIDGEEVFVNNIAAGRLRHHTSTRRIPHVRACEDGQYADIFSEETTISIILPTGENVMKYQLSIDGTRYPALQFQGSENELIIPSSPDDGEIHKIRIIDLETGLVKDEYLYTIKNGLALELDRNLYRPGVDDVGITVRYQGSIYESRLPLQEDSYRLQLSLPQLGLELEVHAPVVFCSFLGKNAFVAESVVWYKDIPADEYASLSLPIGWTGKLMLGLEEVPAVGSEGQFDIGNSIRAKTNPPIEADLWMSLKSDNGERINHKITSLRFAPTFVRDPIEVLDSKDLLWLPQGSFIGDTDTQFRVMWSMRDGHDESFDASTNNLNLRSLKDYPKGIYQYKVFIKKKSLFSAAKEEKLYCGQFAIGDPREYMFQGQEVELINALCWDFRTEELQGIQIKHNCGIAANMKYVGDSVPPGEIIPVPGYSATLFFETMDGRRIRFSNVETDIFEEINPVTIYIINDHLLILQSSTGDAVYVDSYRHGIMSKKPEAVMTDSEMQSVLKIPDYFEYTAREVTHNV